MLSLPPVPDVSQCGNKPPEPFTLCSDHSTAKPSLSAFERVSPDLRLPAKQWIDLAAKILLEAIEHSAKRSSALDDDTTLSEQEKDPFVDELNEELDGLLKLHHFLDPEGFADECGWTGADRLQCAPPAYSTIKMRTCKLAHLGKGREHTKRAFQSAVRVRRGVVLDLLEQQSTATLLGQASIKEFYMLNIFEDLILGQLSGDDFMRDFCDMSEASS